MLQARYYFFYLVPMVAILYVSEAASFRADGFPVFIEEVSREENRPFSSLLFLEPRLDRVCRRINSNLTRTSREYFTVIISINGMLNRF